MRYANFKVLLYFLRSRFDYSHKYRINKNFDSKYENSVVILLY